MRELLGARFHAGVVLYDAEHVLPFGDRMLAVPVSALWGADWADSVDSRSRAAPEQDGARQPGKLTPNPSGYHHNIVQTLALEVV